MTERKSERKRERKEHNGYKERLKKKRMFLLNDRVVWCTSLELTSVRDLRHQMRSPLVTASLGRTWSMIILERVARTRHQDKDVDVD